jgi:hypothetical protein
MCTILRADGLRRTLNATNLVHRGYCASCAQPAHLRNDALICPACGQPAIDEPPPIALIAAWWPDGEQTLPYMAREAILTGAGRDIIWRTVHAYEHDALNAMAEATGIPPYWGDDNLLIRNRMLRFALTGDYAAAQRYYDEITAQAAARLVAFIE